MASESEAPAMEALPYQEKLEETNVIEPTEPQQEFDQPADSSRQQEGSSKASQKSPPKKGIPPKRLSTANKRPVAPTPASMSKTNSISSSRNTPGSGLSKPPTRPPASSSTRRPATNLAGTTGTSSGHKKSSSINSLERTSKGDPSGLGENAQPKTEVKRYGAGRGEPAQANDNPSQDKVRQGQTVGVTQNINSPTSKSVPRSTPNPRLSGGGIPPRNSRPRVSSPKRSAVGNEAPRKRLSTIPASPAPTQSASIPSASAIQPPSASGQAVRPALGPRKLTASMTIEQRLREMDAVHQMLRIAMAEEGDESDEVKEDYGKVDESLASLRTRIQEVRRNEGVVHPKADDGTGGFPNQDISPSEKTQPITSIHELQEALSESQARISELNAEISALKDDLKRSQLAEKDAQSLASERGGSIDRIEKMHGDAEEALKRLHDEQTSKIQELMTSHERDLTEAYNRIEESESKHKKELADSIEEFEEIKRSAVLQSSKEVADSLSSQIEAHKMKLQTLERELQDGKDREQDAHSKIHHLRSDVANLQSLLSDVSSERQKLHDTLQTLEEKNLSAIKDRDHSISKLTAEIEDLQILQRTNIDETKSTSAQKAALESDLVDLRQSIQDLETSHQSKVAAHQTELASKTQEIESLGKIIEEFQDKVQELHELKERGIDEAKHELIQEHERAISESHRKHREEFQEAAMKHHQESEGLRKQHQNAAESTKAAHATEIKDLQTLLDEARHKLEEISTAKTEALTTVDSLNSKISTLTAERDDAQEARLSTESSLKHASDEVLSLKQSIETLNAESQDKDKHHSIAIQKIKDELDSKIKSYDALLEAREMEIQSSLREWQNRHDALSATLTETEKEHSTVVEKLRIEHEEAIQKHTQKAKDIELTHAKEIEASARDLESKHQQDVENLKLEHKREFSKFCQDVQDRESAKSSTIQQAHDSVLSQLKELQAQLVDSQAEAVHAKEENAKLVAAAEEAKNILPDTTEADQLRHEISELLEQHSAEIAKLQEHAALENEKREKERRQGAEVRDRLASESERMRNDLLTAQATIEEHQKAINLSAKNTEAAIEKHAAAYQEAENYKNEHKKIKDELNACQAEIEKLQTEKSQFDLESHPDKQEFEALQLAADRERIQNAKLKEQLHEVQLASEKQATKLREVECALKVTTAELVEAQTSRPNGNEFSASPAPKYGLRSSRWGAIPDTDQDSNDGTKEGEELGPYIEGNLAGIQEQIRQLEDINNDMLEDEHRVMKLLSKVSESSPKPISKDSRNPSPSPITSDYSSNIVSHPEPHQHQDETPPPPRSSSPVYEEL